MSIERAAELLLEARRARRPRGPLPVACAPADLAAAYAVQDRFVAGQGRPVGYKIGYTNPILQRRLGITSPVFGRLLEDRIHASPVVLPASDFATRVIETEVGVRMARGLPPRATPYSPEEVADAVELAFPSFELVDSRFVDWRKLSPLEAIADNVLHSAWVHGRARSDFRALDLAGLEMVSFVNDREVTRGRGGNVLGSPLLALHWLANALAQQGRGLGAGDLVTTGCCTDIFEAAPGDRVRADFGPLGEVHVEFRA
jgi:2-keto-4-pentenoate hydratase